MCGHGPYRKEIVMSDHPSRLPARPSLEQLRKQAKELLRDYHAGHTAAAERFRTHKPKLSDANLADSQFVLAREYGFESWAKLVHHVEAIQSSGRLEQYEKLAMDFVAAYQGDAEALQRLNDLFARSLTFEQLRELVQQRVGARSGSASRTGEFTSADAQMVVARQHGFESWAK